MYLPLFPEPLNGQIPSEEFLSATTDVVKILDCFGKIFMPIKYEMQENIEKLTKKFSQNKQSYSTLQKLILTEKNSTNAAASEAVLWLSRLLDMIQTFFGYIVNDYHTKNCTEDQTANLTKAYEITLEPYQGHTAQQLFTYLLTRMAPTRNEILKGIANGYDVDQAVIIKSISKFSTRLEENIHVLKSFYNEYRF